MSRAEERPLLVAVSARNRNANPYADDSEEVHSDSKYGKSSSSTFKKWEYEGGGGGGRAKSFVVGAASIFRSWPDHLAMCWLSALAFCMFIIVVILTMESSMGPGRHQTFSYMSLQEMCKKRHETELASNRADVNEKTNVYLHIIVNEGESVDTDKFEAMFVGVGQHHPLHTINLFILHNDTFELGYRRNARFKDWEMHHKQLDQADFFATSSLEEDKDTIGRRNVAPTQDFKKYDNVNIVRSTFSNYFLHSPLRHRWRILPPDLIPFTLRVLTLWEHGGITMPWQLFVDKTDIYCINKGGTEQFQAIVGDLQKVYAQEVIDVKKTRDELIADLNQIVDLVGDITVEFNNTIHDLPKNDTVDVLERPVPKEEPTPQKKAATSKQEPEPKLKPIPQEAPQPRYKPPPRTKPTPKPKPEVKMKVFPGKEPTKPPKGEPESVEVKSENDDDESSESYSTSSSESYSGSLSSESASTPEVKTIKKVKSPELKAKPKVQNKDADLLKDEPKKHHQHPHQHPQHPHQHPQHPGPPHHHHHHPPPHPGAHKEHHAHMRKKMQAPPAEAPTDKQAADTKRKLAKELNTDIDTRYRVDSDGATLEAPKKAQNASKVVKRKAKAKDDDDSDGAIPEAPKKVQNASKVVKRKAKAKDDDDSDGAIPEAPKKVQNSSKVAKRKAKAKDDDYDDESTPPPPSKKRTRRDLDAHTTPRPDFHPPPELVGSSFILYPADSIFDYSEMPSYEDTESYHSEYVDSADESYSGVNALRPFRRGHKKKHVGFKIPSSSYTSELVRMRTSRMPLSYGDSNDDDVNTLDGLADSASEEFLKSEPDFFREEKSYVKHAVHDSVNVFGLPHRFDLALDKFGYYFATRKPCNAFLGGLISALQSTYDLKTADKIVQGGLMAFCRGRKYENCAGISLI